MTTNTTRGMLVMSGPAELPRALPRRPQISHVVFDFDGTLSWLRHGWPEIMLQVMLEELPARGETLEERRRLLDGIIHGLNGRPTIMQMIRFAAVVRERGGKTLEPEQLRRRYQDRLDAEIAERTARVASGRIPRDEFVVFGARRVQDGLTLAVLSSTVVERVREEAEILALSSFFAGRIYGCVGDPERFSKRAVFERLLSEQGIGGDQLLSFGDGPVEIKDTKELGGAAVAICSDEDRNGSGVLNPIKREQLLAAGADLAIPDYRDALAVVDHLRGRP
jgi:phosphoglycolate phosphatase-like HAD superfamily hydrolase